MPPPICLAGTALTRRAALRAAGAALAGLVVGRPGVARAAPPTRVLDLYAVNTGERLRAAYVVDGRYDAGALEAVARLLRDHRTGATHPIEPALLDLVHLLGARLRASGPLHVVCGYRSPETNRQRLAAGARVARHSLHLVGRAIDLVVPGRPLALVRRTALALGRGGVGYYPRAGFVHVDTGPLRAW